MATVLHRAAWIATGSTGQDMPAVIADGGVLIKNNRILACGPAGDLQKEVDQTVDHGDKVLTPALVNGHAHLELSWTADKRPTTSSTPGAMPGWISNLLNLRESRENDVDVRHEAELALQEMHESGIDLLSDIGNRSDSAGIGAGSGVEIVFLLELFGISHASEEAALDRLAGYDDNLFCTPHAPYSTGPGLLQQLKKRASRNRHPYSIHLAESVDEIEFLQTGTGPFRAFLEERGVWDGTFTPPSLGPVQYLDQLGLLDSSTLCVHCVHLKDQDIDLLARKNAKVCLCPASNRFLEVGKAPLAALLQHGILPALGTDSLASNLTLSIWEEMRFLRQDHPEINPETIFAMATQGGALALGREKDYGMLTPGKKARLLAISHSENSTAAILEFLTSAGKSMQVEWVSS